MDFELEETSVAAIHEAFADQRISAAELTQAYLERIERLDRAGPTLNSIVTVNPAALEQARELDAYHTKNKQLAGALHGIPVVVKDQAETAGLKTTFGSSAIENYLPAADASVIKKLREAGAIILAKTTMPDFATSWFSFSSVSGRSRNPYDLDRDPGGSSSGTGAAVAANLGAIGLGEDTGGSIRLPASFNALVGLKVTPGLISRNGMSPLVSFQDSPGPMCRTVRDCAVMLNSIAGFDAADAYTATAALTLPCDFTAALDAKQLRGRSIGVVRDAFGSDSDASAAAVNRVIENALEAMRSAGATVVDVEIPQLDHFVEFTSLYITHSRHDIDQFLAARPELASNTVRRIFEGGHYHKALDLFIAIADGPAKPTDDPQYYERYMAREVFQRLIVNTMARQDIAALVFPTTQIPAPRHDELDRGIWETLTFPTNTLIGAQSWMPAISVPAGFTAEGLPVGLEMLGLPYHEADLLGLAYSFEQQTMARQKPAL